MKTLCFAIGGWLLSISLNTKIRTHHFTSIVHYTAHCGAHFRTACKCAYDRLFHHKLYENIYFRWHRNIARRARMEDAFYRRS